MKYIFHLLVVNSEITFRMFGYIWRPIYLVEEEPVKTPEITNDSLDATDKLSYIPTSTKPETLTDVDNSEMLMICKAGRDGSFEVPYNMNISGTEVKLGLTDTIGTDKYRRFREIFSVNTDMFLVCFSVTDPETFENVKNNWLTEIKLLTPRAPFILVGTKSDLRDNEEYLKESKKTPISIQQGIKMGKTFGAKAYVECSSISNIGIQELFDTVVMVLYPELFQKNDEEAKKDKRFCTIS